MVLTAKILAVLMIGSTHYIDIGKDTDAVIYYPSETVAHMTLPDGPTFKGDLKINESGYFVDWQEGPAGDWQIIYEPGTFTYLGPNGKAVGTITKIVPGNAAKF